MKYRYKQSNHKQSLWLEKEEDRFIDLMGKYHLLYYTILVCLYLFCNTIYYIQFVFVAFVVIRHLFMSSVRDI